MYVRRMEIDKAGDSSADGKQEAGRDDGVSDVTPNSLYHMPLNITIPFNRTDAYVNVYIQDFIHVSVPYKSGPKTEMLPYRFGHLYGLDWRTEDDPETRQALEDAY